MFYIDEIFLCGARLQDVSLTWFSGNSLARIVLNWHSALHFKTQPQLCGDLSDIFYFRGSQIPLLSASSSCEPAEGTKHTAATSSACDGPVHLSFSLPILFTSKLSFFLPWRKQGWAIQLGSTVDVSPQCIIWIIQTAPENKRDCDGSRNPLPSFSII